MYASLLYAVLYSADSNFGVFLPHILNMEKKPKTATLWRQCYLDMDSLDKGEIYFRVTLGPLTLLRYHTAYGAQVFVHLREVVQPT